MANAYAAWYPMIFPEKCDGCAAYGKPLCVEHCPNGVFTFQNGKAVVAYPHKCVNGCTACEPICYKKAIRFPKRISIFTPAVSEDRAMLRKTVCPKCGKHYWTNRKTDLCIDCENQK